MRSVLALLLSLVSLTLAAPSQAAEKPLLSASTETQSPGEARPPPKIVRIVLTAIDKADLEQLGECLAAEGLPKGDFAALLRGGRIEAGNGRSLWFVRPALKPYCQALYGAHLFRYFLIEDGHKGAPPKLVFQNGGDAFAIYRTQSQGLNDIEATGCIATECRTARLSFDGQRYRPTTCSRLTDDEQGREIRQARTCGADDWRDDQASGFAPPPKQ